MKSSECGMTVITALPETSTLCFPLMASLLNGVRTVQPRTLAETERTDANMYGSPDSVQIMVIIRPHCDKASPDRLHRCISAMPFRFFIITAARYLRAAFTIRARCYTAPGTAAEEHSMRSPSRYLSR